MRQRLSAKAGLLPLLSTSKNSQEQAKLLEAEIVKLTAELRETESRIRVASPAYAALTQPQPLKLVAIQGQVVDRDTVLLEYALGTEHSYLFAVTPTTLQVFKLPKRAEIELLARQFYELLNAPGKSPVFHSITEKFVWQQRLQRESQQAAIALSNVLLQPAAATLIGKKRVLIVPDGVLHYVPFAALPGEFRISGSAFREQSPGSQAPKPKTRNAKPLILSHEILTLPSASTLVALRREMADRALGSKTLALFADPVFSTTDERNAVTQASNRATPNSQAPGETALRFDRLPGTQLEAEFISKLVPPGERKVALGFEVNRAAVTNPELSQYRYIHFATHGLLDSTHPELSGLVLSQVDAQGVAQNGYLRTMDVFNLKLAADLIVLSGCRTGLGKEVKGEGLIGLTRGFMYAGARRVMASLWQVNDSATAELMQRFYQGMLGDKKLLPAAALRAAQIEMWKDKKWNSAYYWAAFTLQGEW